MTYFDAVKYFGKQILLGVCVYQFVIYFCNKKEEEEDVCGTND